MKITVIGAGLAGLTAAHRLQQAGFSISVLEQEQGPGGRMTEINADGLNYLTGARLIYSSSQSIMRLIQELGLSNQICPGLKIPVSASSIVGEHLVRMSPDLSLLFDSSIRSSERLRLCPIGARLVWGRLTTDPDRLLDWDYYDDVTLAQYLGQKSLDRISEIYIDPVFRGARGWRMTDVSPAFFLSTTAHVYGAHAHRFRDGIGVLTKRLAQNLDVTYSVNVKNVSRIVAGGTKVSYEQKGAVCSIESDLLICAVPGSLVLGIVAEPTNEESQFFNAVKYSSGHILHFGIDRSIDPYVQFFSSRANASIAAIEVVDQPRSSSSYLSRLSVHFSPEVVTELKSRQVLPGEWPDALNDLPSEVLKHLNIGDAKVVEQKIENMLPLFYPGYLKELRAFDQYQTSDKHQIYYAGDYMSHALVGGACRSGESVAQAIISAYAR